MTIVVSLATSAVIMLASALFMACSQTAVKKDEAVLAKISQDGKAIIVTGCKDLPIAEVDVNAVSSLVHINGVSSIVTVSEEAAEKICAVVSAVQAATVPPSVNK